MASEVSQDYVKRGIADIFGLLAVQSVAPTENKFPSLELESVSVVLPSTLSDPKLVVNQSP